MNFKILFIFYILNKTNYGYICFDFFVVDQFMKDLHRKLYPITLNIFIKFNFHSIFVVWRAYSIVNRKILSGRITFSIKNWSTEMLDFFLFQFI